MKVTRIREFDSEDTTMTLRIIEGETCEGSMVTERLSVDDNGETFTHVTLETPSTEDQVYRTLEELSAETEAAELLDEITFEDPASDALELELTND